VLRFDQAIEPNQPVLVEMVVRDRRHVAMPSGAIEVVEHDPGGGIGLERPRRAALRPMRQGQHAAFVRSPVHDDVGALSRLRIGDVDVTAGQHGGFLLAAILARAAK